MNRIDSEDRLPIVIATKCPSNGNPQFSISRDEIVMPNYNEIPAQLKGDLDISRMPRVECDAEIVDSAGEPTGHLIRVVRQIDQAILNVESDSVPIKAGSVVLVRPLNTGKDYRWQAYSLCPTVPR